MKLFGKKNKNDEPITPVNPTEVSDEIYDKYFSAESFEDTPAQSSRDSFSTPNAFAPSAPPIPPKASAVNVNEPFVDIPYQKTERVASPVVSSAKASLLGMYSVIGRRKSQQDALAVSDTNPGTSFNNTKFLAVLCDGMGGMNGGEKASALCIEQLLSMFNSNTLPYPEFYRNAIINIDGQVASLKDDFGNFLGGGSTLISVVIDSDKLYWGSVGDSHIYIIRNNDIALVNTEHNYMLELLEMVKSGKITMEEANADKDREALISYMGMGCVSLMDIIEKPFELQKGDYIVLCSDGLYRSASDSEILSIVTSGEQDMQRVAETLIDCAMAKNNPYQDNTSVIVIKYQ